MNTPTEEAVLILLEESVELAKVCAKILRFGWDKEKDAELHQEIGDVLCLVDILGEQGFIHRSKIQDAKKLKREKLKEYTTHLYKDL